jgi:hypothetical protein
VVNDIHPECPMRHLATRGLLACALIAGITACTEPTSTAPVAVPFNTAELASIGVEHPGWTGFLSFGGTGGDSYYDWCPANSVATGTSGTMVRYNGNPAMYQLGITCRALNADGTTGGVVAMMGGHGLGIGVDAWAPFSAECPSNSILVGASGLADGLIRSYSVTCSTLAGVRTTLGPWYGIGTIAPSAVPYSGECAAGSVIAGVISHAGYVLDGMEFRCAALTGLPPAPPAAPTATFVAPSTVNEGSSFNIALTAPSSVAVTYAFNCGSGYGAPGASPSASCPTTDDASLTVRGRIAAVGGASTEYTKVVAVANVAPSVQPLPSDSLLTGETYAASRSFADPGADSWSMLVDYGFGYGAITPLAGKNFSLSHTYTTAGTFTITVGIRDDDFGVGASSTTVVVSSPAQATNILKGRVSQLVASGDVPPQVAAPLTASLDAAAKHLIAGRPIPAQNELEAFKSKIEAALKSNRISDGTATNLKKGADRIIASSKK